MPAASQGGRDMRIESILETFEYVRIGYRERGGRPKERGGYHERSGRPKARGSKGGSGKPRGFSRRMRRFLNRHHR